MVSNIIIFLLLSDIDLIKFFSATAGQNGFLSALYSFAFLAFSYVCGVCFNNIAYEAELWLSSSKFLIRSRELAEQRHTIFSVTGANSQPQIDYNWSQFRFTRSLLLSVFITCSLMVIMLIKYGVIKDITITIYDSAKEAGELKYKFNTLYYTISLVSSFFALLCSLKIRWGRYEEAVTD